MAVKYKCVDNLENIISLYAQKKKLLYISFGVRSGALNIKHLKYYV